MPDPMTVKERYERALRLLSEAIPEPQTELKYDTPFHLLLAVILSAQCTDKRVNMVTPPLFCTIKGGRTVMENGIVYAQKGSGRFLQIGRAHV